MNEWRKRIHVGRPGPLQSGYRGERLEEEVMALGWSCCLHSSLSFAWRQHSVHEVFGGDRVRNGDWATHFRHVRVADVRDSDTNQSKEGIFSMMSWNEMFIPCPDA